MLGNRRLSTASCFVLFDRNLYADISVHINPWACSRWPGEPAGVQAVQGIYLWSGLAPIGHWRAVGVSVLVDGTSRGKGRFSWECERKWETQWSLTEQASQKASESLSSEASRLAAGQPSDRLERPARAKHCLRPCCPPLCPLDQGEGSRLGTILLLG